MKALFRAVALAAALGASAAVGAAHATSVVFFDDFEDETHWHNAQLTHWNVTNGAIDVVGGGYSFLWLGGDGLFLDLEGSMNMAGRIETKRTFELVLGELYEFSFDYARTHTRPETIFYSIGSIDGRLNLPGAIKHGFMSFSTTFLAVDQFVTISLSTTGTDNIGPKVDNVGLFGPLALRLAAAPSQGVTAAVPTPEALPLLLTALGGLVFLNRRRRRG
ncbi:MAG: VPLPA-CTERM sorting domain-containing protein [Pikeienuella sp.]|uniref:VPLPA-CTERM sorting domain-containing protein n=1 Tax=Pikeienuella sp. TaxID=2831957 RepID=UPI003919DF12